MRLNWEKINTEANQGIYCCLPHSFAHQTVNQSVEFIDSITWAHTNTEEGGWDNIKIRARPRNILFF
ncbi:hypothetical protein HZS_3916 [Henneguya salminicola]|nr:hypothetical protein HZS_3916 [Henneguya salminicola]